MQIFPLAQVTETLVKGAVAVFAKDGSTLWQLSGEHAAGSSVSNGNTVLHITIDSKDKSQCENVCALVESVKGRLSDEGHELRSLHSAAG